jgi:nitrous oxidase accessory protein NosD
VFGAIALALGTMIGLAPAASAHGWWHHSSTQVVHPGESIQAAIDAVGSGGTVYVKYGTYHEHLVITHGVTLVSFGATLAPPASDGPPSPCSFGGPNSDGVCIAGDFTADDMGNITVNNFVRGVTIAGLTVAGFGGSGIMQVAGAGTTFVYNAATDNGGYGIAAFDSTRTTAALNVARNSEEAGFYFGDSHPAKVWAAGNVSTGNGFGFFVRNAENLKLVDNVMKGNCIGVLVLADSPGPAGSALIAGNSIRQNTKACPASDEGPPTSGMGVAIAGGHDVTVTHNRITGNVPGGDTFASGGVVVITLPGGGTAPMNNHVQGNLIAKNQSDITWDGTGSGNVFKPNLCQDNTTSSGLC